MPTLSLERIAALAQRTVLTIRGYEVDGDALVYRGQRPGPDWHVHGWTEAHPKLLMNGRVRRTTLRKRRWILKDRSATTHSRPVDDVGLGYGLLIVLVELFCWLDGENGLHTYETAHTDGPSRRTVQRWLARASPRATRLQSAVRHALIERSETRPMETLFPVGLPPPSSLLRRRWKEPPLVASLWRALTMVFVGADGLGICATTLLAESRGRHDPQGSMLI